MNLPNKLTLGRIITAIIILIMLMVPWYSLGLEFPTFQIAGKIIIDLKYIIAGILFVIAALTDFLDGHIARSRNLVTDFGKVMDAIARKNCALAHPSTCICPQNRNIIQNSFRFLEITTPSPGNMV